jgi:hypothetical protein
VRKLTVGQGVWLYNPQRRKGKSPKLQASWDGPYAVVRVYRNVVVEIKANSRTKSKVVHIDRLAPVKQPYNGEWVLRGFPDLFQEPSNEGKVRRRAKKIQVKGASVAKKRVQRVVGHRPVTRSQTRRFRDGS